MKQRFFLDHNATTPLKPEVKDAMIAAMDAGNPSSVHEEGRKAKALLEDARGALANLVDAPANGLIFTSGGTEAINMALWGMVRREKEPIRRIFVSAIEHDATLNCAETIVAISDVELEVIPVARSGHVDIAWLKERLSSYDAEADGAFLVCVMLANNETGVVQDLSSIRREIFSKGGYLFIDAAQAVGKIPVSFNELQADLMSIAAHKFGGPKGVGALVTKPGIPLAPFMLGGGQELRRRGGTENMIAIAGLGAAAKATDLEQMESLRALVGRIEGALKEQVADLKVWGEGEARLPNTLCFSAPGFSSETQVMVMDLAGIAVSSGSACSSGKVKASHVLEAMGASADEGASALRVSLGWNTEDEAVEKFIKEWSAAYARAKKGKAA